MTDDMSVLPATERQQPTTDESNVTPNTVTLTPSVGQQLRVVRESKKMSASEVAQALKLSVRQVHALEADDWSSLPGTIVRGFIRNYARLLNLDSEALMNQIVTVQMPPPELHLPHGTSATLPTASKGEPRDRAVMLAGLMLVSLALLAYFFAPQDFWQSKLSNLQISTDEPKAAVSVAENSDSVAYSPTADSAVTPRLSADSPTVPPEKSPLASSEMVKESAPSANPLSTVHSPTPLSTPAANPSSHPSTNLPASGGSLKLSFGQPSWVEIRDRSGQIVFSQLNPAGSQREIEGQAPFTLVIGNASSVTVQYKGKTIDLTQRSKDDVARLTLE
jgi:cytoskeleton protein RodZ